MKRIAVYLGVLFQVFVFSSLPVFAAPADLLKTGLDSAATDSGYNKTLSLPTLIGKFIGIILGIIGIVFVIYLIIAGITYFTAAGDNDKVKKAKAMIRDSVIGIIIMISAYAISSFVVEQLANATK